MKLPLDISPRYKKPALAACALLFVLVGYFVFHIFAAGERMYFGDPSITNPKPGDTFSIDVKSDSSTPLFGAEALVKFPADKVKFLAATSGSGPFPSPLPVNNQTAGQFAFVRSVDLTQNQPAQSGNGMIVTTLSFQVLDGASGNIDLSFDANGTNLRDSNGDPIAPALGTASIPVLAPLQAPGVPTGLAASNVTQTSTVLNWAAATGGGAADNYIVTRNGVDLAPVTATTFSDSGLAPSTTYTYQVRAHNSAGDSTKGNAVSITTQAPAVQAPAAPSSLSATSVTATSFILNWAAGSGGGTVSSYVVSGSGGVATQTVGASTFSASFNNLSPNTDYVMSVRATNQAGSASSSLTVHTPDAPPTQQLPQANLYLDPGSAVVQSGDNLDLTVRVDDLAENLLGAQVDVSYDATKFDVVNASSGSGPFPFAPSEAYTLTGSGANSHVIITRSIDLGDATINGTGLAVSTITFHAHDGVNADTGLVINTGSSFVYRSDGTDTLKQVTGANVTIYTPSPEPEPNNPNPPTPTNPPAPSPKINFPTLPAILSPIFGSSDSTDTTSPSTGPTSTNPGDSVVDFGTSDDQGGVSVNLSIVDANGKPLPYIKVQIAGQSVTSDNNGHITLDNLAPGKYKVVVKGKNATPSYLTVESSTGNAGPQKVTIKLANASNVGGVSIAILALLVLIGLFALGMILVRMGFFSRHLPKGDLANKPIAAPKSATTTPAHTTIKPGASKIEKFDGTSVNTKVYYPDKVGGKKPPK